MVRVTSELTLPITGTTLYSTCDPLLSNTPLLLFYGPSTTTNSTLNSSRIQVHVFSAAGFTSYPRITISPNSPLYATVNYLPRDRQGDEICRGLAFGLFKYFKELPEIAKSSLILQSASSRGKRPGSAPTLFSEQHAADLASSMVKVENVSQVMGDLEAALRPQYISHVDIDLVLPPGSIAPLQIELADELDDPAEGDEIPDPTLKQYGAYAPLVKLFGDVGFLPTSKLRRAPSKPTTLNKSRSFLKDQKLALRREMGEMVETEERYVSKLHELVNAIAVDFRQKARSKKLSSSSPSFLDLQRLFPPSLDRILELNSDFFAVIRKVLDETEEEAMGDLEAPLVSSTGSRHGRTGSVRDPTGALALAKIFLEWFPQFSGPYQEYIHASQEFPQIISGFMKQPTSFSQRVQQTGEQRLRSAIIEPVQRLPRYTLFIDKIVNGLPGTHPALDPMLKARDMITEICSLDSPATDRSHVVSRLRHLIEVWPSSFRPQGRLITAVDFAELTAPFNISASTTSNPIREGMLLLFADCVVVLRKAKECGLSARGLIAEIDKPSATIMMASVTAAASGQRHVYELGFSGWHALSDTRFTMAEDGRSIWMASSHDLKDAFSGRDRSQAATIRHLFLQTTYDGKALKLMDELTKARIEGRFSEVEREMDTWVLRQVKTAIGLNMHTAVFAEGLDTLMEGRKEPCPIRVVIDHAKGTKGAPVGHYGVEIMVNVTTLVEGAKYRLEVTGLNDSAYVDEVVIEHFLPIFAKRVVDLIQAQHQTSNATLAPPLISYYSKVLRSMHIVAEGDKKGFRPSSPVKLFSSLLNAGFGVATSSQSNSASLNSASRHAKTVQLGAIPSMAPDLLKNNNNKSTQSIHDVDSRSGSRSTADDRRPVNALFRLEETFTAYIAALQSRKGNILSKSLRNRAATDELAVNALYNSFIEKPFDTRASTECTVDVIFVAFEKFLRLGWQDHMGQVMSLQTLEALQENALNMHPGDFADYVGMVFSEMAPQNRRAFIAIIKLLADLLQWCGNDGDKGAMTASFAELLVVDGHPHDYINLLDRVVAESERLFEDIGPGATVSYGDPTYGSTKSRSNTSASGSITANTSSLRRRFDTLLRQNSNRDNDGRPTSVWRTLSKSNRHAATGDMNSYFSKATLKRSQSTESRDRRPTSRDRPTVMGAFDHRPSSSHGLSSRLSIISASPPLEEKKDSSRAQKKKRRSSLSDLKAMMTATSLAASSPTTSPSVDRRTVPTLPVLNFNASPRTPSPTRIPVSRDRPSTTWAANSPPGQKENTPVVSSRNAGNLTERPQNIMSTPDMVVVKDLWYTQGHTKIATKTSNIPTLRSAPHTYNSNSPISRPTTSPSKPPSPQKLRLQSPQKLRERLQNEAKAVNEAEVSLQSELHRIGEEMAKLNPSSTSRSASRSVAPSELSRLQTALGAFEARLPTLVAELNSRNEAIKSDLENSLQASEYKVKGLDQLYKEASAENELLYEKFNGELGRLVKALKGKDDKQVLLKAIEEAGEREISARKEVGRLKRELLSLRTLLKGKGEVV